jgi:hypothetical protein
MLDTFSMVEVWRRLLAAAPFSDLLGRRLAAAVDWLDAMVDPRSGQAPNLGANDGASLLALADTDYRDFRPSVQLASALFRGRRRYDGEGSWNTALQWLEVALPQEAAAPPSSHVFDQGGYALLRAGSAMALLRYPRFRFRPSQADILHVDLWVGGMNHLRDAGTYSYNADPRWLQYFPGTESHNTVQFDGRDQMPRLGRFLFGDWPKARIESPLSETADDVEFGAGYRDGWGATHARFLKLTGSSLRVRDRVAGFSNKAVLRWRLKPGTWSIEGGIATNGEHRLSVTADVPVKRLEIVEGWESLHYNEKSSSPVLEVEVGEEGTLTTEYVWHL